MQPIGRDIEDLLRGNVEREIPGCDNRRRHISRRSAANGLLHFRPAQRPRRDPRAVDLPVEERHTDFSPLRTLAQQACNRDRSVVPGWPADLHNSANRYPGVLGQTPRERLLEERRTPACRIEARANEVPFALAKRPASRDLGGAHTIAYGQGERASLVDREDKTAILGDGPLGQNCLPSLKRSGGPNHRLQAEAIDSQARVVSHDGERPRVDVLPAARIVSVGRRGDEFLLEAGASGMPIAAYQLDDIGAVPRFAVHIDHEADRLARRYAQAVGVADNDLGRDLVHVRSCLCRCTPALSRAPRRSAASSATGTPSARPLRCR